MNIGDNHMDARQRVVDRLHEDLVGPYSEDEILRDSPAEVYFSGILYAQKTPVSSIEPEDATIVSDDDDETSDKTPPNTFRPSSMGVSFAIAPKDGNEALIAISVSVGTYEAHATENSSKGNPFNWHRHQKNKTFSVELSDRTPSEITPISEIPGLGYWVRCRRHKKLFLVTVMLVNQQTNSKSADAVARDTANFYQARFSLEADPDFGLIVPKPSVHQKSADPEIQSNSMLYRDAPEYAVGHTCSVSWRQDQDSAVTLSSEWLPTVEVPIASASGDEEFFSNLAGQGESFVLGAEWLSEADGSEVVVGLAEFCQCYSDWIAAQDLRIASLTPEHHETARRHLDACRQALNRMLEGAKLLANDPEALLAFRLANRALWLQNEWKRRGAPEIRPLVWRPFQLAFGLLCLSSTSNPTDTDRAVMDLLWFPTGGGKTEAYLLLAAYVVFLRRLKARGAAAGAGVTIFMRYTLRLLTAQQFQRAASMILACDMLRRGDEKCPGIQLPDHFQSDASISIGLWVGKDTSPNTVKKVGEDGSPAQVADCPICGEKLDWSVDNNGERVLATCSDETCSANGDAGHLPFWTVDEDVYRELPSLLIGTADKFVQIVSKPETGRLFGLADAQRNPPDLIIQDELHLISGPLGTMAGLFETAIDALCSHKGHRPKIIGSTATIRRADDQIRSLFNRESSQFPPPGIDQSNSGFAYTKQDSPGRLYVGITSAGRTASYIYQAISASLLQAASDPGFVGADADKYWTLVGYFNSLRELGSASIIMQDDVTHSIQLISERRAEKERHLQPPTELTSRVKSDKIKEELKNLELDRNSGAAADIVLASNMISVGMDIRRLGLMLVNGQPKTIAEYIQATSRVGRSNVPGLVITLYNANKMRDRSRYESFPTWHGALYRDVEATGVTPFAPRARDKALHAPFVAMVRHLVPEMLYSPNDAQKYRARLEDLIDRICERVSTIDEPEAEATRKELIDFLENWIRRGNLKGYWDDWSDAALLISAEKAAESQASNFSKGLARATPNTLRSVEASTKFVITEQST
ncbi:DNA helicase [Marivivens sp. LCG002]|uniref:helicase-related protein n=1 Tax=Marivivens sp. LCG002 TaxID=3051171 RepID=UPI0025566A91|nr:helicase-related protein [Marivivens sp. LCG002]WIV50274.1 DNA helicase [Marivivens sp. LCG002]